MESSASSVDRVVARLVQPRRHFRRTFSCVGPSLGRRLFGIALPSPAKDQERSKCQKNGVIVYYLS
jgi:hypothetical protein